MFHAAPRTRAGALHMALLGFLVGVPVTLSVAGAVAQEAGAVSVLRTEAGGSDLRDIGAALDRLVRARLDALSDLELGASPDLDLEGLQLAVGCVARSATCYAAIADQLGAGSLLVPSVHRAADELVLTL